MSSVDIAMQESGEEAETELQPESELEPEPKTREIPVPGHVTKGIPLVTGAVRTESHTAAKPFATFISHVQAHASILCVLCNLPGEAFDPRTIKEFQLDERARRAVDDEFILEMNVLLVRLEKVIQSGDYAQADLILNAIKGACMNLGARRVGEICNTLRSPTMENEEWKTELVNLRTAVQQAFDFLEQAFDSTIFDQRRRWCTGALVSSSQRSWNVALDGTIKPKTTCCMAFGAWPSGRKIPKEYTMVHSTASLHGFASGGIKRLFKRIAYGKTRRHCDM